MAERSTTTARQELLTGWGRTMPTRATVYTATALDAVIERVTAASPRGVIARGLGRSYGDAAQNAGGDVVLCTDLDRVRELDVEKGTCTVEAGLSLDTLLRVLLPLGWFPMVVPGTRYVTIGGAIASDIHGKFRHGTFADYVTRMQLVTPAGGVLTATPDTEPEAFWATAGGMGLTGVITEATMQLQPVESSRMVVDTIRAPDIDECMARMTDGIDRYRYSVAWVDCLAKGAHLGRSVVTLGNHATLDELTEHDRATARSFSPRAWLKAPPWMPAGLLNSLTVRAFNEVWLRKAPRHRCGEIQTITEYFHPLDFIDGWNRVYGPPGFVQYQFVVPDGEEHVIRVALERLSAARAASFVTVLKRFEHDSRGMIGFPMSGWTLALDVPASGHTLATLLDGLDELVVAAGGRVYLTKDARLRPELVPAMYPGLDRWRAARGALDPDGVMLSDMDRRLGLSRRTRRARGAAA
jgi:decaprenylphospho-beta-D-ribofuranose 2-oxidase